MKAVIFAISVFLPFSFSVASAQLTKITVGYSAMTSAHLPAWSAKESGICQKWSGCAARLCQRRSYSDDGAAIKGNSYKSGRRLVDRGC